MNKFIYIDLCILLIYIFILYVFKYLDLDIEIYAPIIYLFNSFDLYEASISTLPPMRNHSRITKVQINIYVCGWWKADKNHTFIYSVTLVQYPYSYINMNIKIKGLK